MEGLELSIEQTRALKIKPLKDETAPRYFLCLVKHRSGDPSDLNKSLGAGKLFSRFKGWYV